MLLVKQIFFVFLCITHMCVGTHACMCVCKSEDNLGFHVTGSLWLIDLQPFVAGRPAGQRASCLSVSTSTSHLALLG